MLHAIGKEPNFGQASAFALQPLHVRVFPFRKFHLLESAKALIERSPDPHTL